jgi:hypothetical protein
MTRFRIQATSAVKSHTIVGSARNYLTRIPGAPQVQPQSREQDEALRKWMDKTPAMAAAKGSGKAPGGAAGGKEGGKDGKGKKKK